MILLLFSVTIYGVQSDFHLLRYFKRYHINIKNSISAYCTKMYIQPCLGNLQQLLFLSVIASLSKLHKHEVNIEG